MPARHIIVPLLMAASLAAAAVAWTLSRSHHARPVGLRPSRLDTTHYTLYSYATPEQTRRIARAAEALHSAYGQVFGEFANANAPVPRLQMVLYGTRAQFKANNRSSPWAEAYYQQPRSHAYYNASAPNPYHWMVHEATHQLNTEWAHLRLPRWISEGVASYFGTSRIENGVLHVGEIDPNTYPAWWLPQLWLSTKLEEDLARGRLIPLQALITDTGPDIDQNVNLYYIEYWSFVHFLLDYDHGRYAERFKSAIAAGGSLADVERLIGPLSTLQAEWHAHLTQLRHALATQTQPTGGAQTTAPR